MRRSVHTIAIRRICETPNHLRGVASQPLRLATRHEMSQRRTLFNLPTALVPPAVFLGLGIGLWTWKCCMMILFQNKIIYMPSLPPNSRWETIADYKHQCGGIQWEEEKIRSLDGTSISLCLANVDNGSKDSQQRNRIYILYFQGNASSLPPRLPFLSPVLRMLRDRPQHHNTDVQYTMVCCSYRGYWTSKGRPSEKGITLDAAAALEWIKSSHKHQDKGTITPAQVIIWGQSIGAGVATNLAAQQDLKSRDLWLKALILETPFLSVRAMLETLYPQKWLPYRYLWPFLRNYLDSSKALGLLGDRIRETGAKAPRLLILEAGRDELVPISHGDVLEKRCLDVGLSVERKSIGSALHNEVLVRPGGRTAVVEAIFEAGNDT